ncbi:SIS domain-containing protein [Streptomyces violaceorubidus]|uniref:SIS domain-containing protein n=1 Tax=Streptomyces violaceorubidus TaxID=284042 RepID=UPI00068C0353|nr:SIS domain-containing protein [Streptomyces violaceorubidus]
MTHDMLSRSPAAKTAAEYLKGLSTLALRIDMEAAGQAAEEIAATLVAGGTVFVAGNGGSASTASHVVCDLLGTCRVTGHPHARVVGLADNPAVLTALANDTSFEEVFAHQVVLQAAPRGLLLLLSVSGKSSNLLRAAEAARAAGARVVAWVGVAASSLAKYCDVCVSVDSDDYGLTEDLHLALNHIVARRLCGGEPRRCGPS